MNSSVHIARQLGSPAAAPTHALDNVLKEEKKDEALYFLLA